MDLGNLKPAKGSIKTNQRLGRGQGSTKGGTAGRGHNGQKSRSGYSQKFGFEGGQQPIQTRVPKFGFKNINRIEYKGVNLDTLQMLADNKKVKKVDKEVLREHGLVSKNDLIKILGRGELKAKLEITANAFSKTAKEAIEAAGGQAIELPGRRGKKENKPRKKTGSRPNAAPKADVSAEANAEEEEVKEEEAEEVKTSDESTDESSEATAKGETTAKVEEPKSEAKEEEVKEDVSAEASKEAKEEEPKAEAKEEEPKAEEKEEEAKEEEAKEEEVKEEEKVVEQKA
ncbi:MAG: 50S ribosomal protein L15 [Flavobacteriales bacterium]|nr:50S ribosomal protein L15 [Flavobacteriales bacterium]